MLTKVYFFLKSCWLFVPGERSAEGCILTNGVSCFALLIGIGDKLVTNSPHNGVRCDEQMRLCVQISGHNSCSWYFHRSSPCAAHSAKIPWQREKERDRGVQVCCSKDNNLITVIVAFCPPFTCCKTDALIAS